MQNDNFPFKAVPQNHWPRASTAHKCVLCGKSFGLFQVAENCRGCGRVCCSSCLPDRLVLPGQPGTAPVPVCPICAKSIKRTHEEAEMAMQRCQLLEEILKEQALQVEKMRSDLREQQEENKLLYHEKERLKATIARMEIEAEVAAAKVPVATAAATSSPSLIAASPNTALSVAVSPAKPDSETSALGEGLTTEDSLAAMEEKLRKKKRQLDLREATLKDALKKVSADAAKNADQRAALQEQEKQVTTLVTAKLTALFEEERQRLEDICTGAVTDVQHQYMVWVRQQQDGVMERRRKYEQLMEERQQRTAAELAEVRSSRDALQHRLERQSELIESLQANAAAAPTDEAAVTALLQQQQQHEAEKQALENAAAAAVQRAENAEEEVRRLQVELESTKLLHAKETQARDAAFAVFEAEQRQAQQRLEAAVTDVRAQQSEVATNRDAAVAAAVDAAERKAEEHLTEELTAQQARLAVQAAADVEAAVQRVEERHAAALEKTIAQHKAEKAALEETARELQRQVQALSQQTPEKEVHSTALSPAPPPAAEATVQRLKKELEEATAALAQLHSIHEQGKMEWSVREAQLQIKLREAVLQWEKAVEDGASAMAAGAREHDTAITSLTATYREEKEGCEKRAKQLKRTQETQELDFRNDDKTWKEEKVMLQKTVKDLETRLETRKTAVWQLQQQLRDCKQQLADAQALHQKKTEGEEAAIAAQLRAATALQRSAAALVKEVQQTRQRILAENAAALTEMRSSLQETIETAAAVSSQKEGRVREAAKPFHSRMTTLKREREEAQRRLKVEQEKRSSTEAEVEKLKAALQRLQTTEQRQRQALAVLQEGHQAVVDGPDAVELETAAQVVPIETRTLPCSNSLQENAARHFFQVQQRWVQQQAQAEGLYAMTLITVLQHEWFAAMDAMVAHLADEAERQRQLRARNAKALEDTTSTIKEVQEDLRVRALALVDRQTAVEEQERRVAEKKKRMNAVCRNLYAVAQELRKKHHGGDDSADLEEVVCSVHVMGGDVCSA